MVNASFQNYEAIPENIYDATLQNWIDAEPGQFGPRWKWIFKLHNFGTGTTTVDLLTTATLSPNSKATNILHALGIPVDQGPINDSYISQFIVGRPCRLHIKPKLVKDRQYNNIEGVLAPLGASWAQPTSMPQPPAAPAPRTPPPAYAQPAGYGAPPPGAPSYPAPAPTPAPAPAYYGPPAAPAPPASAPAQAPAGAPVYGYGPAPTGPGGPAPVPTAPPPAYAQPAPAAPAPAPVYGPPAGAPPTAPAAPAYGAPPPGYGYPAAGPVPGHAPAPAPAPVQAGSSSEFESFDNVKWGTTPGATGPGPAQKDLLDG